MYTIYRLYVYIYIYICQINLYIYIYIYYLYISPIFFNNLTIYQDTMSYTLLFIKNSF